MARKNIMIKSLEIIERENRKLLRELLFFTSLIGINFNDNIRSQKFSKFITFSLVILSCCGLYGQCCFVIKHMEEPFTTYIECICTSFQCILSLTKLIYGRYAQQKLYNLLEAVQKSNVIQKLEIFNIGLPFPLMMQIRDDITDILSESWLLIRRQLVANTTSVGIIATWYLLSAFVVNTYHQIIATENYTTHTPFPNYFPQWESKQNQFPYYELRYLFSATEVYVCGLVAISFEGIFTVLALHGMTLIRILHVIIRYSTHASIEPHLRVIYLRNCIHYFERCYGYYNEINTLFKFICLPQFGISLFILAMVVFQASVGLQTDMRIFVKMLLYVAAVVLGVFVYCYNGQKLTTESEKLNFSWYDCDWYQESTEFKHLVKMMILRGNRTMPMDVAGLTTMSLMTFVTLMQTSVSYFLLLQNVSQNKA